MPREGKAKVLDQAEFRRLLSLQKLSRQGLRNTALLYCSFGLGLRAKELARLSIGDVLNSNDSLKGEVVLTSNHTKNGKQRHIYLSNSKVISALRDYLDQREDLVPERPLFLSQKDGRFSPNTIQMLLKRLYVEAGIEGASSHSGRRTFATRLIENGADIKAVSKLMGHSTISMTAKYVEDNPERLKKLAAGAL
jgi:integrase/recombinase XerD